MASSMWVSYSDGLSSQFGKVVHFLLNSEHDPHPDQVGVVLHRLVTQNDSLRQDIPLVKAIEQKSCVIKASALCSRLGIYKEDGRVYLLALNERLM